MRIWLIMMMALGMTTFSIGGVTEASADLAFPDERRSSAQEDSSNDANQPQERKKKVRIFFSEPQGTLEVASIMERLRVSERALETCYVRQLEVDPALEGIVHLLVEIRPHGTVESVFPLSDSVEDAEVTRCATRLLQRLRYRKTDVQTSFILFLEFGSPLPEESPFEGTHYSLDDEDDQSGGETDGATEDDDDDDDEQSSTQPPSKTAIVSAMSLLLGFIGMSWGFISLRRRD